MERARRRRRTAGAIAILAAIGACAGPCAPGRDAEVVPRTPERVARGAYLVNHVAVCGSCHTTRDSGNLGDPERRDALLAGGNAMVTIEPPAEVWVPNLTGDAATGLGRWSDGQIMRAIRDGVDARGLGLVPQMPFASYRHMSDDDVRAVVAYLRSIPAQPEPRREERKAVPFLARALASLAAALRRPARGVEAPPPSDAVAHGEYLAHLATCSDCHSLSVRGPRGPGDRFLAGSDVPFAEGGLVYASNITPDPDTGIGSYSHAQVKRALRDGVRLDGKKMAPPMSTVSHAYAGMTDEDLDALVAYLFAQQPIRHVVPARRLRPAVQARAGE